jgi:hypothetical protein
MCYRITRGNILHFVWSENEELASARCYKTIAVVLYVCFTYVQRSSSATSKDDSQNACSFDWSKVASIR